MTQKILRVLLVGCLVISSPSSAFAVGSGAFENASFSALALGQGNAVVASPEEPAAISYNPAGIVDLPGIQVQSTAGFLSLTTHIDNDITGDTQSSSTINFIPTSYLTINPGDSLGLNDRLAFGIGSDSPFGFANKYDSNHAAVRYTGFKNYLKMWTIKPTVAIRINDWLSIGGGPMYYNIFKFGGILAYPNRLIVAGLADGQLRADLKGNSWGWQLGVLAKPHPKHSFGFHFRSPVHVKTKGFVEVENSAFNGNFRTGAKAKINLPMSMFMGYAFKPNHRTKIETNFGFTRWSNFNRLFIDADSSGSALDDIILRTVGATSGTGTAADKDYRNGFTLNIGGHYKATEKLTLRGGAFYFWTPVPKDHFIPAIPDSNRLTMSLGFGYDVNDSLTVDMTYYGMYFLKRNINNAISEVIGGSVDGEYFSHIQALVLSMTLKWDVFESGGERPSGGNIFHRKKKKDKFEEERRQAINAALAQF